MLPESVFKTMSVSSITGIQLPQTVYQEVNATVGKGETITLSLPIPFKNPLKTVYKKCNVTSLDPPVDDEDIKLDWSGSFPLVRSIRAAIAVSWKSKWKSISAVGSWIRHFVSVLL